MNETEESTVEDQLVDLKCRLSGLLFGVFMLTEELKKRGIDRGTEGVKGTDLGYSLSLLRILNLLSIDRMRQLGHGPAAIARFALVGSNEADPYLHDEFPEVKEWAKRLFGEFSSDDIEA